MGKLGKWITMISAILMGLCIAPILLYVIFGPSDGNPVGLGLLMFFGTLVFGSGVLVGGLIWMIAIAREASSRSG